MTTLQAVSNETSPINLCALPLEENWFAIQTRPRYEKKVALELRERGIQTFLPLTSVKRQWSDRKRLVSLPLFPGYAFVRIPAVQEARIPVLRTNGVSSFVGPRGMGTPIADADIATIQTLLEREIPVKVYPYLNVGQTVRVRGGCLDGMKGILTKINGDESLVISVDLIQKSIAMRVTGYEIEPI